MPHTIRKNAREWQRLWRGGDIITEIDGDDPGMPRRTPRERKALARPLGLRGRTSTARKAPSRGPAPADSPAPRRTVASRRDKARAAQVVQAATTAATVNREAAEAWDALATHAAGQADACRHGAALADRTRQRFTSVL